MQEEGRILATPRVVMSRRNLQTLLNKLDRVKAGEDSNCTLIKHDTLHPKPELRQNYPSIIIKAVEDGEYYVDRVPGDVLPVDEPGK